MSETGESSSRGLIGILVIIALIPILFFAYFWYRGQTALRNAKPLPADTLSAQLRLVQEIDPQTQKIITYWVIDTSNHSSVPLYKCRLTLFSQGDQKQFTAFSKNFVYQDCSRLHFVNANYRCRLENALLRFRSYEASRIYEKLPANSSLTIAVGRYYVDQTVSSQSYLSQKRLSDIANETVTCLNSSGSKVQEVINAPFPTLQ